MKSNIHIARLISLIILLVLLTCKKDDNDKKSPVLTTNEVSEITHNSAISGGNITDEGGYTITERGVCWNTGQNPTINDNKTSDGSGAGSFTSEITGLEPETTYYVRAYATNSAGTAYGNKVQFTTVIAGSAPIAIFSATPTSGIVPLTVIFTDQSANNPANWQWDFGDGNTNTDQNPEHVYQNAGSYNVSLTASNEFGIDVETKTGYILVQDDFICGKETIADIDGNVYNTVLIGTQCWMKENLKTTTYNNGTPIPNVTNAGEWENLNSGAYVWFYNDVSFKDKYGALYNWFAAIDPNGLCPKGWHLPSNAEWAVLTYYIGGTNEPHGNELKSCRQIYSPLGADCNTSEHPRWNQHSIQYGTDDHGFSGLPGGYRWLGSFGDLGSYGGWWSSTEHSSSAARLHSLSSNFGSVFEVLPGKKNGHSVRCLRDGIL